MSKYDYLILGAGAAGLMMAYRMSQDAFFNDKSIAIIEEDSNKGNDRTWCYWEEPGGEWDHLLEKTWDKAYFGSAKFSRTLDLEPLQYKMLRSGRFYDFLREETGKRKNIEFIFSKVERMEASGNAYVIQTTNKNYVAQRVLSSLFDPKTLLGLKKSPYLKQHFIGWFVKVEYPVFNPGVVNFMDFNIAQRGNTRFMYLLPTSSREALLEYTLFSEDLLEDEEYEAGIREYLTGLNPGNYEIVEKERGNIPMSNYPYHQHNEANLIFIGTAGGWTKASTGYTFYNSSNKTKDLVAYLKSEKPLNKFYQKTRFEWYDKVFMSVLQKHNHLGSDLFADIFRQVEADKVLRFLSEESKWGEEFEIMNSVPKGMFIKEGLRSFF